MPRELSAAEIAAIDAEATYFCAWKKDADEWAKVGLYRKITELADPQDDQLIVDIGTGTGVQLLHLMAQNPRTRYIGTERTPHNVSALYTYWKQEGFEGALAQLHTQEMAVDADGHVYWKQRLPEQLVQMRDQVRAVLTERILVLDDDIRRPESLPVILGNEKIDTAIFSQTGGSPLRPYEWPYKIFRTVAKKEAAKRTREIGNSTRTGFYHFASKTVRDGGRMIVAERASIDPKNNILEESLAMISAQIGSFKKYWKPMRGAEATLDLPENVELVAGDKNEMTMKSLKEKGRTTHSVVMEFIRTALPFNEPELPRPREQ